VGKGVAPSGGVAAKGLKREAFSASDCASQQGEFLVFNFRGIGSTVEVIN
jgi:hypothetical protein